MAKPPALTGKPDDLVYIHVKLPLWLKRKAVEKAKASAQDLTEYLRALLIQDLGAKR